MKPTSLIVLTLSLFLASAPAFAGSDTISNSPYELTATSKDTWGGDECWGYLTEITKSGKKKGIHPQKIKVYRPAKPSEAGVTLPGGKHNRSGGYIEIGSGETDSNGYYEVDLDEAYRAGDYYIDTGSFADGDVSL